MNLLLGVNIDHVATLRQARYAQAIESPNAEPSPLDAALDAIEGGADSITIHVRGDLRHMQTSDAHLIRKKISLPLNLEIEPTDKMIDFAQKLMPDYVCLVPENRQEITTEGGLNLLAARPDFNSKIRTLKEAGIKVSLFIDPDLEQIQIASQTGAQSIELHTGCFANATEKKETLREQELKRLTESAKFAHELGLQVNAGHGLNYKNLPQLLATVPHLTELNIGHSIISRAIRVGLKQAVREMHQLINKHTS